MGALGAATPGIIIGGLCCLGLLLLGIVTAIVISLIPVYTSNNAVEGYGEGNSVYRYRI